MTISLKHVFESEVADGSDDDLVQPSDWNAEHVLTMATARLLGRTTASGGAAEEIAAGAGLSLSAGQIAAYAPFGDPDVAVFFDDFLGSLNNVVGFFANGGGSALEGGNAFGAPGVMQLNTGTGSTGRGGVIWPVTNTAANQVIYFGAGRADFRSRGRLSALSDGTNTYSARAGFTRDPSGTPVDGLYFEYDPTTRGNDNWWCVSRNNNSNRAIDSAVAASTSAFQVLSIEVNAAGTEVVSRIDGTVVDTNTTNIPSGSSRRTGYGAAIQKSAGTTGRTLQVDYVLVALHFSGGRP